MMASLFSSFDPATSQMQLNWGSSLIVIMIMPLTYWISSPQSSLVLNLLHKWIYLELKTLLGTKHPGSTLLMTTMFISIMANNLLGLFPYIFTSSSHFSFSLSLALPSWISFMIFGWLKTTNTKFIHLVPEGTPPLLMPFTVMIETLSTIIRPGVITLRLMTNMTAGHFLITLLGNSFPNLTNYSIMPMIMGQSLLVLFEMMVSCIQAYVFAILISLYFEE